MLVLALSAFKTNAQFAVYGNFDLTHLSDQSTRTSAWLYGPGVGIYYNFLHLGPIAAGADLRGNFLFASKQGYQSELLGLRIAAKPPVLPLQPYAQVSAGLGGSKYDSVTSLPTRYSSKFAYQIAGGLDYTLIPHLALRLGEVAYTHVNAASDNPANNVAHVISLSTGAVFRF